MKFVKDNDEERRDYILQKDKTTKSVSKFVIAALIICILAVIVSAIHFEWF